MNERIKELAEQAGPNIVKEFDQEDIDFCEKFAELIVQECITVINSEKYRVHSRGWNDAIEWADGMIKQHFGVEE